jgi:predicted pyridoxine 5'-phosphate oxidase superfamily flavin-nucleotide-binding protein
VTLHDRFSEGDAELIARCSMFFLATADAEGWPDVSYKGGMPGFVRLVDEQTLAFPDYDGNGMFKSLGNVLVNPNVGLLFIDLHERPRRLRVNGAATVSRDDKLLAATVGAQMIVRVKARAIFPNCPRYIHRMQLVEHSVYAPGQEHEPPEPAWKQNEAFRDALPRKQPAGDA